MNFVSSSKPISLRIVIFKNRWYYNPSQMHQTHMKTEHTLVSNAEPLVESLQKAFNVLHSNVSISEFRIINQDARKMLRFWGKDKTLSSVWRKKRPSQTCSYGINDHASFRSTREEAWRTILRSDSIIITMVWLAWQHTVTAMRIAVRWMMHFIMGPFGKVMTPVLD